MKEDAGGLRDARLTRLAACGAPLRGGMPGTGYTKVYQTAACGPDGPTVEAWKHVLYHTGEYVQDSLYFFWRCQQRSGNITVSSLLFPS